MDCLIYLRFPGPGALLRGNVRRIVPGSGLPPAGVAQLVEQLICNQQVTGSSPIASSRRCAGRECGSRNGLEARRSGEAGPRKAKRSREGFRARAAVEARVRVTGAGGRVTPAGREPDGEVPKRSNGADCKSAGLAFGGSNPPLSTRTRRPRRGALGWTSRAGIAQLARARAFQARGRGFESRFPLHPGSRRAHVAQLVEHVLGKDEVSGPPPLVGPPRREAAFESPRCVGAERPRGEPARAKPREGREIGEIPWRRGSSSGR